MAVHTATNFLAVGPHCWGKGKTMEEAIKNAKQNWPAFSGVRRPQPKHFSLYTSEGLFTVDGMGGIHSTKDIIKIQTSILAVADKES